MTVSSEGICSDSKEQGRSWAGPATEARAASNAASGAEAKQARSVFSFLGRTHQLAESGSVLAANDR